MWEEEKEFEILHDLHEHELSDEHNDDFLHHDLEPSDDEDIDLFEYEADLYLEDDEDY